jgi:hypothetical protein
VLCAGFRQSHKRRLAQGVWALAAAGLLFAASAWSAASPGFVYCLKQDGLKIFAGTPNDDGSLRFGLSVWSPSGQNISVFGTAQRHGREWQYVENLQATTAAQRCRLEIERGMDGSLRVQADPTATCQSHGGVNAEIGKVQFPSAAYEGAVTTELDDPEAFQKAGRCS